MVSTTKVRKNGKKKAGSPPSVPRLSSDNTEYNGPPLLPPFIADYTGYNNGLPPIPLQSADPATFLAYHNLTNLFMVRIDPLRHVPRNFYFIGYGVNTEGIPYRALLDRDGNFVYDMMYFMRRDTAQLIIPRSTRVSRRRCNNSLSSKPSRPSRTQ